MSNYHNFIALVRFSLFILIFSPLVIEAHGFKPVATPIPADVSFLIVDVKYNEERGAQICEIQHGGLSGFKGDVALHEQKDRIVEKLVDRLSSLFERFWTMPNAFIDQTIKQLLAKHPGWEYVDKFEDFDSNEEFLLKATLKPENPQDISAYHGLVCISPALKIDWNEFQLNYPGVIFIDSAFHGYATNKLTMTKLLMQHPFMKEHKPKWGSYRRNENDLAERIEKEIGSDLYVLKPLDEFKGTGVIIFRKEELQTTLDCLFKRKPGPHIHDRAYEYWRAGNASEFIVEEFIEVDPVLVSHLEGNLYCPTLRMAFLLCYNKNTIHVDCLGSYYTLPRKSLNEPGSLNERYKSHVVLPYFAKADPEIQEKAEKQVKEVLNILYQRMLGVE